MLAEATALMARELAAEGEVRLHGFGRLKAGVISANTSVHGAGDEILVPTVRFKAFSGLREALGGRVEVCRKLVRGWMKCRRPMHHGGDCSLATDPRLWMVGDERSGQRLRRQDDPVTSVSALHE